jgi:hypothetical protein
MRIIAQSDAAVPLGKLSTGRGAVDSTFSQVAVTKIQITQARRTQATLCKSDSRTELPFGNHPNLSLLNLCFVEYRSNT